MSFISCCRRAFLLILIIGKTYAHTHNQLYTTSLSKYTSKYVCYTDTKITVCMDHTQECGQEHKLYTPTTKSAAATSSNSYLPTGIIKELNQNGFNLVPDIFCHFHYDNPNAHDTTKCINSCGCKDTITADVNYELGRCRILTIKESNYTVKSYDILDNIVNSFSTVTSTYASNTTEKKDGTDVSGLILLSFFVVIIFITFCVCFIIHCKPQNLCSTYTKK